MKLQRLLVASMVVVLVAGRAVFGGPTPPVVSGSVADFTGNQSGGVRSGFDFSCPPIYTLNVYDLTTNIGPIADDFGIALVREASDGGPGTNASVWWPVGGATGGNGWAGSLGGEVIGSTLVGPTVNFTGGAGGEGGPGDSLIYGKGGNGGPGGTAGPVEIYNHGGITITSTMDSSVANGFTAGILGQSLGGISGNGGTGTSVVGRGGGALGSGPGDSGSTVTAARSTLPPKKPLPSAPKVLARTEFTPRAWAEEVAAAGSRRARHSSSVSRSAAMAATAWPASSP